MLRNLLQKIRNYRNPYPYAVLTNEEARTIAVERCKANGWVYFDPVGVSTTKSIGRLELTGAP